MKEFSTVVFQNKVVSLDAKTNHMLQLLNQHYGKLTKRLVLSERVLQHRASIDSSFSYPNE